MHGVHLVKTDKYPNLSLTDEQKVFISTKDRIVKALEDDNCIGYNIETDNQIVGFILIKRFDTDKAFLWNMFVDERFQKRGIGTLSLQYLVDQLRKEGVSVLTITCSIYNRIAIEFYEKFGFSQYEIIIRDNIQEMNLILSLNNSPVKIEN